MPDITEEDFELPLSVKDVAAEASAAVPLADKEIVVVEMTPQSSAASQRRAGREQYVISAM